MLIKHSTKQKIMEETVFVLGNIAISNKNCTQNGMHVIPACAGMTEWRISTIHSKKGSRSMKKAITIGIDLAKNIFHLHGADKYGKAVWRKRLNRDKVVDVFS